MQNIEFIKLKIVEDDFLSNLSKFISKYTADAAASAKIQYDKYTKNIISRWLYKDYIKDAKCIMELNDIISSRSNKPVDQFFEQIIPQLQPLDIAECADIERFIRYASQCSDAVSIKDRIIDYYYDTERDKFIVKALDNDNSTVISIKLDILEYAETINDTYIELSMPAIGLDYAGEPRYKCGIKLYMHYDLPNGNGEN